MADRSRCFCGSIPVTIDNLCEKHRHHSKPIHRPVDLEQQVASLMSQRSDLERRLSEARHELSVFKAKAGYATKILHLLALGDIQLDELDGILRTISKQGEKQ